MSSWRQHAGFQIGLLGCSLIAACATEASSPAPSEGTPVASAGASGTSPSPTAGMPGAAGGGTASVGGNATGGNTTGGNAGSVAVVPTAGTSPGTAGAGTAGSNGGGALTMCPSPPAAGMATDVLIDDLEDKDNGIAHLGGRTGFWYTYADPASTIVPKPDPTGKGAPLVPGMTNCHGGSYCILVSGTTAAEDDMAMKYPYAGVGFDFSNAGKPCVYNGSAYSGIKFWARGDAEITIKLNITGTADKAGGGDCMSECNNGHGKKVVLTPDWAQVDLPFASIMQDPTWGTQVAFDKSKLLSLQLQFPSGGAFSAAFDDFTFY